MEFNDLVAIVLAGNDENPNILGGTGQPSKLFMPFCGELVGDRILRAIDGLGCCKSIYIAAPSGCVQAHSFATAHSLHLALQGETSIRSMMNGVREAQAHGDWMEGDYVLVVSADLPLLSTSALERFLAVCQEAPEADLYLGMVPQDSVAEELLSAYERDFIPFRGGLYLHTEVYLLRPDSMSEVGRRRFEEIMTIRRLDRSTVGGALKIVRTLMSTVGLRALLPFARILVGGRGDAGGDEGQEPAALDPVEKATLRLARERLGPRVSLVTVDEQTLGLEFDHREQLKVLEEYAGRNG